MVRAFTDAQLDRTVKLVDGLPDMNVGQVIDMLLVGHAAGTKQHRQRPLTEPHAAARQFATRWRRDNTLPHELRASMSRDRWRCGRVRWLRLGRQAAASADANRIAVAHRRPCAVGGG